MARPAGFAPYLVNEWHAYVAVRPEVTTEEARRYLTVEDPGPWVAVPGRYDDPQFPSWRLISFRRVTDPTLEV
jgi:hypothetical protein